MSKRYEITSEWRQTKSGNVQSDDWTSDNPIVTVTEEVADIRSTRDGWEYRDGAYRVRAFYTLTGKAHTRSRTFYGESAWSNSARQYGDIVNAVQFSR